MSTSLKTTNEVFIGYDRREDEGYEVCRNSILRRASKPVHVTALKQPALRRAGLYRRAPEPFSKQDTLDGLPFSTEFSFTRFLVPVLMQWDGWALFCDCDILFRSDITELFSLCDDKYAIMCVKHNHIPAESRKMDGMEQRKYTRKNWSSVMLINCSHESNKRLGVDMVNNEPGSFLHQFKWLNDEEIGEIPIEWNYLVGYNNKFDCKNPKAVHFTEGLPCLDGYMDCEYSEEWWEELNYVNPCPARLMK